MENATSYIRFCWLRESMPGHLERDGGLLIDQDDLLLAMLGLLPSQQRAPFAGCLVSLDAVLAALSGETQIELLPAWVRKRLTIILGPLATLAQRHEAARHAGVLVDLANRIRAAIPAGAGVEVHLPYLDRRAWPLRFQTLDNTEFVYHYGRVLPADVAASPEHLAEYTAQWLAACSADPSMAAGLAFTHSVRTAGELASILSPVPPPPQSGTVESVITLELAASACRAWFYAPLEKSGAYFPVHASASVAVQAALRRWVPWHCLSNLEDLADTATAYPLLAYMVSRPFPGRRRTDFTYDTLSKNWTYLMFQFARRPLRLLLSRIHRALIEAGRTELAAAYHPDLAKDIIAGVRKERRAIQALVAAEGAIVNQILKFGLELRVAEDPRRVTSLASEFAHGLGTRLRRLFRDRDLTGFGPLVLIEATNALSKTLFGEPALRVSANVRQVDPRDSRGFCLPSAFDRYEHRPHC